MSRIKTKKEKWRNTIKLSLEILKCRIKTSLVKILFAHKFLKKYISSNKFQERPNLRIRYTYVSIVKVHVDQIIFMQFFA